MRMFANESPEPEEITITVSSIDRETERAIQISAPDGEKIWLPKSQIEQQRRLDQTGIDIIVPAWLYNEKEMEKHGL